VSLLSLGTDCATTSEELARSGTLLGPVAGDEFGAALGQ
jgi:hypothetical protein